MKPKSTKQKIINLIFVFVVLLMLIPQTRKPIQIVLQKAVAKMVKPQLLTTAKTLDWASYDWKLNDSNEEVFNFEDTKGKVIIINFWATWCPPCIAEMSDFQNLFEIYQHSDKIEFLFVSQEEFKVINDFMKRKNYSVPFYRPITKFPKEFNLSSIPRTFIIDQTGQIVLDKTGVADWDGEKMKDILDVLIN